jgi:predicted membrane GTPase involved in stress response
MTLLCCFELAQVVYTSAIQGIAGDEPDAMAKTMQPLFDVRTQHSTKLKLDHYAFLMPVVSS